MTLAPVSAPSPVAVEVTGVGKRYPGVVALDEVSLSFAAGEATAVLGENGAGKSTLMNILAGLQRPDRGTVTVGGSVVETFTPDALLHEHRVALVPQEIALCSDRTVAENVMLGNEGGLLPSRRRMVARTGDLLDQVGMSIDPRRSAGALSVAEKQMVLIVRALARECRVLILDEPTTSLTAYEVSRLFGMLERLRTSGVTIIFISHRMPEIYELCEHVHVLRDGRHVGSFAVADVAPSELVARMVGRDVVAPVARAVGGERTVRLQVDGLDGRRLRNVSLTVGAGEVVGVAGLPESGRDELVTALFGATRSTGSVSIDGAPVAVGSPRQAIANGIGYVPAERRSQAIFPDMSVGHNAVIVDLAKVSRFGLVNRSKMRELANARLAGFDVRGGGQAGITELSGGNQQKVILARWLSRSPRVLLLDDPTRGVDVGAKAEIHERIVAAADGGAAVLMASSDLPELLYTCDRIIVMADGEIAGSMPRDEATEENVMALATGTSGHGFSERPTENTFDTRSVLPDPERRGTSE